MNNHIEELQKVGKVVVLGNTNAKVWEEGGKMVGKWEVTEANENGECLVGLCAERKLFLSNVCF